MTLTKPKPKRLSLESRKRLGHHHRHSVEYVKTYWPYLPVVAILSLGLLTNVWLGQLHRSVLGYATDMTATRLLDDTNQAREQAGLDDLHLNNQLASAAQAKAADMARRNYWSHVTPDGQTPWSFISAAGYHYEAAGENLAYGFTTADDTVAGWMNSPEHRANILNANYANVGFGIVDIPDYQHNGPETLVVAMYGMPVGAAIQTSSLVPNPLATNQPMAALKGDTLEPPQYQITRLQLVAGDLSMNIFVLVLLGFGAASFLVIRHGLAWRRSLLRGETFVLRHPGVDIVAACLVTVTILLGHSVGLIR